MKRTVTRFFQFLCMLLAVSMLAGCFNDDTKGDIYWAGRCAAREVLPKIQELVASYMCEESCSQKMQLVCPRCYTPDIYLE